METDRTAGSVNDFSEVAFAEPSDMSTNCSNKSEKYTETSSMKSAIGCTGSDIAEPSEFKLNEKGCTLV